MGEDFQERRDANRLSEAAKCIHGCRKEKVERCFAGAKELHGYRYACFRGLAKLMGQCLLSAACQNMKKMVLARQAAA